ncbi:LOW QUALITY PROTEIN: uncharacterized protein LOC128233965 [Mya arenaria]|uniref:LOW QUALITY PROTEIN: uncharacterized protein LOC128233965 n=1 Tax=Mya arenaria TaxID=6604 RepID=UPI0022E2EB5A|nr:LOW QUALITY PROTEIN: uncharacterized protein LOC128233965 [Mya arenaria]
MASYKEILKEKDNQNWLKGSLALRITKAGLRGLVEGESHRVHQNIHYSVLHARHLAAGTTCSLCLTEHVLPCPTKGLCSHPRNCKYHNTPFKIHRPCPSQICDDFRDEICAVHRYSGPSWKNTKANQWCTNHWQVAKCFMPPDGYHDVTSYDESDFNGIISVMINCTEFQRRLSFPIGNQPNPLSEARVIGRNIRHSTDLKLTDTDLAHYFTTLNTLLTDSTFLASDMDAQQAVLKLQQLEKGTLPITTEEVRELLEEARATVEAGIESGKRQLAETAETGKKDLEGVVLQGKTAIESGTRQLVETAETGKTDIEGVVLQGKTAMEAGTRQLAETAETGKKDIECVVSQSKTVIESGKRLLAETAETGKKDIEGVVLQGKTAIESGTRQLVETAETGKKDIEGVVLQGKRQLEDATKTGHSELKGVVLQGKTAIESGTRQLVETAETGKKDIEGVVLRVSAMEAGTRQLVETAETGKKDIEGVVSLGKLQFEDAMKTAKSNLEVVVTQGKLHLEDAMATARVVTERGKLEIEDAVAKSRDTVQVGKRELEEALQKMKALSTLSEAEQREDLRRRLIKYYQKQLNSAPISPLLSDKDERLDKFYVPPKIEKKDHRRLGHDQQHAGSPISSYKQIFSKDKGLSNTVFVVGEAGMGKSSFSAMCTIKWAAQFFVSMKDSVEKGLDQEREENTSFERPLLNKKGLDQKGVTNLIPRFLPSYGVIVKYNVQREFLELYHSLSGDDRSYVSSHTEEFCELLSQPRYDLLQDEVTLKDFEFMFHIKLRDCCESCELSDMIRDQLVNIIYRPKERAAGYDTMISVLSNRKCVVIADGLDEWSHPTETKCSCSLEDKVIPHLSQTLDAAVLITSRPWRLPQNRVKDTKIGKYLEIKGVASTSLLIQKTLVCLNEKVADKRICIGFIRFVARRRLARLLSVPISVLLLVCLWFEGRHEPISLCDMYAYMLDMMLGRKSLPVLSVSLERTPLLQCFKQTKHVRNYYNIVLKLAKLAFEKLFSGDRKSSLVFQNVDCLTSEELLIALKSGIMRETKSQSLIRKSSSFSFIHKTVQEFIAAVHIAHHTEDIQRVIKPDFQEEIKSLSSNYQLDSLKSDVSQVFIYMCGLNSKVAQDMSAMMSTAVIEQRDIANYMGRLVYSYWCNTVQLTLCAGYREAEANNVQNIQLELMQLYINGMTRDLTTLKTLISMNKSPLRHITINGHEKEISEEELQEVFISSKDTLTHVEIRRRAGQYDLSACCRLQYLTIYGFETSNITINTHSLVELTVVYVTEKVERSIVQSLEQKCEQLMKFTIWRIKNISLFCKTLPQLNHLKQIKIMNTTLGDHPLLLPPSVNDVHLIEVTMSARCLRELVERVEKYSHTVNCCIDKCTVEPIKDYEDIKRNTQSSKNITFC